MEKKLSRVILVGNPNVGKSVIFNHLTGKYVTVSNYPGTTVDFHTGEGRFGGQACTVIDTPGVNSLVAKSEDEQVTLKILSQKDIACVVQIGDSKNIIRTIILALQLKALELPIILDLNMADEAKERGIDIDIKGLSQSLGIEVISTTAITAEGVPKLKSAIAKKIESGEFHGPIAAYPRFDIAFLSDAHRKAKEIQDRVFKSAQSVKKPFSQLIGNLTVTPLTGVPILLVILFVMYEFVGNLAAQHAVDFLESVVFEEYVNPFFVKLFTLVPIKFIRELFVGEYGIFTMAVTYALAIILPIVTSFFIFFGFLEDSGYLPRLAALSNRVFRPLGLNGRAIMPMVLGLGCGTMATLTSRILDTKKERILVTILLALCIPCSAQLGVILGVLGSVSFKAFLIWLFSILFVLITIGMIIARLLPGQRSAFIQEIPPIRAPQIKNIITKTLARLKWYLKEAVPLFILGTLILFVLDKLGVLRVIERALSPLIVGWLGLPIKMSEVFLIGFLRRDYGAAGIFNMTKEGMLSPIQIIVSLVTITLFVPCVAQVFMMIKERGMKTAALIFGFVSGLAFLFGGLLNMLLKTIKIV